MTDQEGQTPCGVWFRVSSGHQESANQVPDVERFVQHHGYAVAETYTVDDSAWKNGGGPEYRATLKRAMQDAWEGKFSVLVVWSLDRIVRNGAEELLKLVRELDEHKCTLVSVKEPWINGADPRIRDILLSFAGWMAQQESERRSERIKAGIARLRAKGEPVGRKLGAKDKTDKSGKSKRRTSGYYGNQNAAKPSDQAVKSG